MMSTQLMSSWPVYSLVITIVYQLIFFVITLIFRFDMLTDIAGTSNFLILALIGLLLGGSYFNRQIILVALISAWSIRLGSFLLFRVITRSKDSRFDLIRKSKLKLLGFWGSQAIWVYVTSLPMMLTNMMNIKEIPVDTVDYIGWGVWSLGFLYEGIADLQKYRFTLRQKGPRPKPFLDKGLWKNSRHPNYFGEITLWFGIWISAANGLWQKDTSYVFISLLSPICTFILLVFISGMPIAETKQDKQNYRSMAYKQYKFTTSPLIPLPRSIYSQFSVSIKRWVFFDRYQLAFFIPATSNPLELSPRSHRHITTSNRKTKAI